MNKVIVAGSVVVLCGLGFAGFFGFKMYKKGEEATAILDNSLVQLKNVGIEAKYELNKGLFNSTGKYYIEDVSTIEFNVEHGLDVLQGAPIKVSANLRFSDQFKNTIKSDEKKLKQMSSINNGNLIDSNLMNINAEIINKSANINIDLIPIEINYEKPMNQVNSLNNLGVSGGSNSQILNNQVIATKEKIVANGGNLKINFNGNTNIANIEARLGFLNWFKVDNEANPILSLKNIKFKKDFMSESILLGKYEFTAEEYNFQNVKMKNILNTYSLSKQKDGTYSMTNGIEIPNISVSQVEPNASISFLTSLNKLKGESVEGLLSLLSDMQNFSREARKVEIEKNMEKKAELEFKAKEMIALKTKKHLTGILLSGFDFSIDKAQIISSNSGNLGMVLKLGVAPSTDLAEFNIPSKLTVQSAVSIKGGQFLPMLPIVIPQDSGITMEKTNEFAMNFVYHKGNVFVNNKLIPDLSNTISGVLSGNSNMNLIGNNSANLTQ